MKTIKVVAAIIKKKDQILIAQRLKGEFAGQWEFPGGKIEENETPQEALQREIFEEMELNISIEEFLTTVEYDYPNFHLSMDCFICSMKNDTIILHDHAYMQWISLYTDLQDINWIPADIQIINALQFKYKK